MTVCVLMYDYIYVLFVCMHVFMHAPVCMYLCMYVCILQIIYISGVAMCQKVGGHTDTCFLYLR